MDNKEAIQNLKVLRSQLPPYDVGPEIKELADLQLVKYPENQFVTDSIKSLHSQFTLDAVLDKLQPELMEPSDNLPNE